MDPQTQALKARLDKLDIDLARAQGALIATLDVLGAIIRSDPERLAAEMQAIQPRQLPNAFLQQGYQEARLNLTQQATKESTTGPSAGPP